MTGEQAPAARGRKPKGMGPERREEILAHALRLFSEHGVHTVSTRQIAAAVGISQPSLYAYFPTRQALLEEVCARAFRGLTQSMEAVARAPHTGRAMLTAMARVYIEFGLREPDAYRVAFMLETGERSADGEPVAPMMVGMEAYAIHRAAVAEVFGKALEPEWVELLAQSLWASLHGLVSLLIARPTFPWGEREKLIALHIGRLVGPESA
jgi:AcrR family transcriptional regulator